MDWLETLEEILNGFKRIGIFVLFIALCASIIWGFFSIVLIVAGKLPFSWWYSICWVILLCVIAGVVGSWEK